MYNEIRTDAVLRRDAEIEREIDELESMSCDERGRYPNEMTVLELHDRLTELYDEHSMYSA